MAKEIRGSKDFEDQLDKLGALYEEGKDCLHRTYPNDPNLNTDHSRLYEILREMRDMCAVQLQQMHWIDQN